MDRMEEWVGSNKPLLYLKVSCSSEPPEKVKSQLFTFLQGKDEKITTTTKEDRGW